MRKLFIKNGKIACLLEKLANIIEIFWIKNLVIPIITVIPAASFTYLIKAAVPKNYDKTSGLLERLYVLTHEYPISAVCLVALYLILVKFIHEFILSFKKKSEGINDIGLLTLFDVLEKIVAVKAKRFGKCATAVKENRIDTGASEIFERITQPEQQIALITNYVHAFFDTIDTDGVSFRVSIVEICDNKPVSWFYFYPESEPPLISLESLSAPGSALSYCIEKNNIVVIEDVGKEAAKGNEGHYISHADDIDDEGSLICYPIVHHHTDSTPYVLTIVADKKGYFSTNKKKLYKWILKHFAIRIGLEHSLLTIKKGVKL